MTRRALLRAAVASLALAIVGHVDQARAQARAQPKRRAPISSKKRPRQDGDVPMKPVRLSRVTQRFANPSSYGSRSDSHGSAGHHTGVDFGGKVQSLLGFKIRSVDRGVVVGVGYDQWRGNFIDVRGSDGSGSYTASYWHMRARSPLNVGRKVRKGTVLGRVGSSGNSSGPHLHYQESSTASYSYHAHRKPRHCWK